jgi:murein DD-endopeptidase MepM/ murein hydrolase activator NlpD
MHDKKISRLNRLKKKLNDKYRLVIMNDTTLERKFSFRLTRMNVFVATGALVMILVIGTTFLIAYTPLREYIPGYGDVSMQKDLYALVQKADSLQYEVILREKYMQNIRDVINGKDFSGKTIERPSDSATKDYDNLDVSKSKEDSLLRQEFEELDQYSLMAPGLQSSDASISNYFFFTPIQGSMTNGFNPASRHYGIDLAAQKNDAVKSVLDGTVLISAWTLKTGYVIAIQHQSDIISVYKHNSALLKREGDYVKAGDPVAIVGNSGELTTGPHLHFELWYKGKAVNPRDYITF